jgi:hypothetical protein
VRRVAEVDALLASAHATAPGTPLSVLFCRQGLMRDTTLHPGDPAIQRWWLRPMPEASPAALERRRRWLELVP